MRNMNSIKPLPAKAITGPTPQAVRAREVAARDYRPRVVSLEPGEGTVNVAPDTELRVRFDRPMHPSMLQLEWEEGGFRECHPIHYDERKYEFTIPICLEAGCQQRIVLNPTVESAAVKGFQSVQRTEAESMTWTFSTQESTQEKKGHSHSFAGGGGSDSGKARSVVARFNQRRGAEARYGRLWRRLIRRSTAGLDRMVTGV
jgi:hypothetical protein